MKEDINQAKKILVEHQEETRESHLKIAKLKESESDLKNNLDKSLTQKQ
jgi:hypothetical protein